MDEERIVRTLVGSFNPEDATELPFAEQQQIIREITGYRVSDPAVALAYLEQPQLGTLVDDPVVRQLLVKELTDEGYILENDRDLKDYLNTHQLAILARNKQNWLALEERYPENFQQLLLEAGTVSAREHYMELVQRELEPEEVNTIFQAALHIGEWENLAFLSSGDYEPPFTDDSTPEGRAEILEMTLEEVAAMVEYETEHGGDDATTFFPSAYYKERAVEPFLAYMKLWPNEIDHIFIMGNLPGFIAANTKYEVDLQNPIIQAYLQTYPDFVTSKALLAGGGPALHGLLYNKDLPMELFSDPRVTELIQALYNGNTEERHAALLDLAHLRYP